MSKLSTAISTFVAAYKTADIIEFTVDTSMVDGNAEPFLNLWAWRQLEQPNWPEVLLTAVEQDDLGFVYDALEPLGDGLEMYPLQTFYTGWPEDVDEGDRKLRSTLIEIISGLPAKSYWFHHVDCLPIEVLDR